TPTAITPLEPPDVAAAPEVLRTYRSSSESLRYIGGVIPSRPTTTTVACHVPSPCFSQRGMNTCAPVFRSDLPPATRLTTSASLGTTMVFSPSLYLTCSVLPSTFCTCCATAPLVIVLFAIKSHG